VKFIAIEEHFSTSEIRAAWAASPIGQEGTAGFDRGDIEERLDDLGQGRIALMDESGVDVQVLSVTTHPLTLDRSIVHSLVGCRGEQCQLQTFCREPWIC
jgi:hypothetical protein